MFHIRKVDIMENHEWGRYITQHELASQDRPLVCLFERPISRELEYAICSGNP